MEFTYGSLGSSSLEDNVDISLSSLLKYAEKIAENDVLVSFGSSENNQVKAFFSTLEQICLDHGFTPFVNELALLAESSHRELEQTFYSYLDIKNGNDVIKNRYLETMRLMKVQVSNLQPEPIVTHHDLLNRDIICYSSDIEESNINEVPRRFPKASNRHLHLTSFSVSKESLQCRAATKVTQQLNKFVDLFTDRNSNQYLKSLSKHSSQDLGEIGTNCSMLAVPIFRPSISREDFNVSAIHQRVGVLLLLLKEPLSKDDSATFIRDIITLITKSTQLDLGEKLIEMQSQQDVIRAAVHSAVNAIRGINSDNLFVEISEYVRGVPKNMEQLSVTFEDKVGNYSSQEIASEFVSDWQRIKASETVAAMMCSLAEISLDGQGLRKKYQQEKRSEQSLYDILYESKILAQRHNALSEAILDFRIKEDTLLTEYFVPKGYVHTEIIKGIFIEIFRNSLQHAKKDKRNDELFVISEITLFRSLTDSQAISISVSNYLTETNQNSTKRNYGFLENIKTILKSWGNVNLKLEHSGNVFTTTIELGGVYAVNMDGHQDGEKLYLENSSPKNIIGNEN